MRRVLLAIALIVFLAQPAAAEYIVVYGDEAGTQCGLASAGPALLYVFDYFSLGSAGAKFRFDTTGAPGTMLIFFGSPYTFTGDVNSQISIDYGACLHASGPSFMIGTLYLVAACGTLGIQDVTLIDCQHNEITGNYGWPFHLCDVTWFYCPPSAAEPSTWGTVKALYR